MCSEGLDSYLSHQGAEVQQFTVLGELDEVLPSNVSVVVQDLAHAGLIDVHLEQSESDINQFYKCPRYEDIRVRSWCCASYVNQREQLLKGEDSK